MAQIINVAARAAGAADNSPVMPHITAVGTSIPEFVATNEYVISLALELSRHGYAGDVAQLEHNIRSFLEKTGAKQRWWRAGFTKSIEAYI
jgi:hypothetical protein